uniref:Uncharacterized protein n=1 Tax=Cacopsylla melanoneura TaxID=428564 RepID=A0A8D8T3G7_9HEMI
MSVEPLAKVEDFDFEELLVLSRAILLRSMEPLAKVDAFSKPLIVASVEVSLTGFNFLAVEVPNCEILVEFLSMCLKKCEEEGTVKSPESRRSGVSSESPSALLLD